MATATSRHPLPPAERVNLRIVTTDTSGDPPSLLRVSVKGIRTGSMTVAAVVLGLVVAVALTITGVVAWWAASRMGLVDGLEEAVATGLGMDSWTVPATTVLVGWVTLIAAVTGLAVIFVVLLTIAFNGFARAGRGLQVLAQAEPIDAPSS